MKRFKWRLQRLLDVKTKQEELKKAQLFALTQQIVQVRHRLFMRQARVRLMLAEVAEKQGQDRLGQQQMVLGAIYVADEKIKELKKELDELGTQKKSLTSEVLELRRFRKGLERLREIAKEEYDRQVGKFEQNQLDETANISFARAILENACATGGAN